DPCPGESTKRSRSNHLGFAGLCLRNRVHRTYAIDAAPIGIPGCPLSAFCTASTDRKRRVLMHSLSNAGSGGIAEGAAFIRLLRVDLCFAEQMGTRGLAARTSIVAVGAALPFRVGQIGMR